MPSANGRPTGDETQKMQRADAPLPQRWQEAVAGLGDAPHQHQRQHGGLKYRELAEDSNLYVRIGRRINPGEVLAEQNPRHQRAESDIGCADWGATRSTTARLRDRQREPSGGASAAQLELHGAAAHAR